MVPHGPGTEPTLHRDGIGERCHDRLMRGARLPAGWALEAIRNISGDREAMALDTERSVEWVAGPECRARIHPEIVLGFHGLCLVKPVNDEDWYMGSLNGDGSVDCWSAYSDLHEALRGL
ncbi:hypothetical protein ACH4VT_00535 [Streptomyces lydicus]|uniref:hypothetical protein n=1 Tax=Streptomyces lydicus TaxID=47763 RepID=UPI0037A81538